MATNNDINIYLKKFKGINNKENPNDIDNNELVDALNVMITNKGSIITRPQWKYIKEDLIDGRSIYSNNKNMYFLDNDKLCSYDRNFNLSILDLGYAGLNNSYLTIMKRTSQVLISNNNFIKVFKNNKIYKSVIPEKSNNDFNIEIDNNGTFPIGIYKIAITFLHDDKTEGTTTSPIDFEITNNNSSVKLLNIEKPIDFNVNSFIVYISMTNSLNLYKYGEFSINTEEIDLIYNQNRLTSELSDFLINREVIYSGRFIEEFNGVILSAKDDLLYFSMPAPFNFVSDRDNYLQFDGKIGMLASVKDGFYVSDEYNTYFITYQNGIPSQRILDCRQCIFGAFTKNPITSEIFFFTQDGQYVARDGGSIENITDKKFIPSNELIEGSSILMEYQGMKQLINTFKPGVSQQAGFGDWAKISVD